MDWDAEALESPLQDFGLCPKGDRKHLTKWKFEEGNDLIVFEVCRDGCGHSSEHGQEACKTRGSWPRREHSPGWWPEVLGPIPVLLPSLPRIKELSVLCVSWSGSKTPRLWCAVSVTRLLPSSSDLESEMIATKRRPAFSQYSGVS